MRTKPAKPHPDFPLYPHKTGKWAKKIRGRVFYFGKWEDPEGALQEYLAIKDELLAGQVPVARSTGDRLILKDLLNEFLTSKEQLVQAGDRSPRTLKELIATAEVVAETFGKMTPVTTLRAPDFDRLRAKLAARFGPVRLGNEIQRVRSFFKYAYDTELLEKPVRFGPHFIKPSKSTLRLHRAAQVAKFFEPTELRDILAAAGPIMQAMILLGVNAGLGNSDISRLTSKDLDLEKGILASCRGKTGIARRAILWPETIQAIQKARALRPAPAAPGYTHHIFLTRYGRSWVDQEKATNAISFAFWDLVGTVADAPTIKAGDGRNFYALRHITETVGSEVKDQAALDLVMGHVDDSMGAVYRERIGDDRLQAIADHLRAWLQPELVPGLAVPAAAAETTTPNTQEVSHV